MRDTFEQHGSAWFAPCQELHSGPTFQAASEPRPAANEQQQEGQQQEGQQQEGQQQQAAAASEGQQQQEQRWQSQWAAAGWLQENPLVRACQRCCCCCCCCLSGLL